MYDQEKSEEILTELEATIKSINIYIMGVPEREKRKNQKAYSNKQ